MKRIGILHITDLHHGSQDQTIGHQKDSAISTNLSTSVIYSNCLEAFCSSASNLLRPHKLDIIVCTGDLGNKSNSNSINNGALYISQLAKRLGIAPGKVIVSPGNHDINRHEIPGQEDKGFTDACKLYKFKYATQKRIATIQIHSCPIIALNTCIGGTERAFHGAPEKLWGTIKKVIEDIKREDFSKEKMQETLKEQMDDLDIPAVGNEQIEETLSVLTKTKNKMAIIIGHHAIIPAPRVEIRPYCQMIDAGLLLHKLVEQGKKVIYLHGHVHCNSSLAVHTLGKNDSGFVASIGSAGLHGAGTIGATFIQITISDSGDFLSASVFPFEQHGDIFCTGNSYRISCPLGDDGGTMIEWDKLTDHYYTFELVARKLGRTADEQLAEDLLRATSQCKIQINRIEAPPNEWEIRLK